MHTDGSEFEIATISFENGEFSIEYGRKFVKCVEKYPDEFLDMLLFLKQIYNLRKKYDE